MAPSEAGGSWETQDHSQQCFHVPVTDHFLSESFLRGQNDGMKIQFKAFTAETVTEMKKDTQALSFLFEVCVAK